MKSSSRLTLWLQKNRCPWPRIGNNPRGEALSIITTFAQQIYSYINKSKKYLKRLLLFKEMCVRVFVYVCLCRYVCVSALGVYVCVCMLKGNLCVSEKDDGFSAWFKELLIEASKEDNSEPDCDNSDVEGESRWPSSLTTLSPGSKVESMVRNPNNP